MSNETAKKFVVLESEVISEDVSDYTDRYIDGVVVLGNPLRERAEIVEGFVVVDAKGCLRMSTDYKALRRAAYPEIGDQLDALYRARMFPDDMENKISAVKARYPQ